MAQPPFAGVVADVLFGGAARSTIRSILSACGGNEHIRSKGCSPSGRFISFGHDEEQGGIDGAKSMADLLLKRGVQAEFLVDEGGLVTQGVVPALMHQWR